MGKAVKSIGKVAAAPFTGGLSLVGGGGIGGVKDLLFGKEEGGSAADPIAADVRRVQLKALQTQEKGLDSANKLSPEEMAKKSATLEKNQILGSAADARRQLQQSIAQRGLGRSSIGLAQEKGIGMQTGRDIAAIDASLPQRTLGYTGQLTGLGTQVGASQNAPIQMRDIKGQRQGGISGLLGAGAGAMMGGPQGAAVGMNVGQGLGGVFG
jgi:hypothetical protein